MKKILIFSAIFLAAFSVSAQESFYAELEIKEVKTEKGIAFSLKSASAQYGEFDNFYETYNENSSAEYILETYDSNKQLRERYSLKSSRFYFYDTYNEEEGMSGGIGENDEGTILAYIPYDRQSPTAFIKIDNKGVKTDFIALPVSQLEEEFKKIPLCKKENETGNLNENKCCAGLMPKITEGSNFVCLNCGNNVCEPNENFEFCPGDCPLTPAPVLAPKKSIFLPIAVTALTLIFLVLFIIVIKLRKN